MKPIKPFFNGKDTQCWSITFGCIQDLDDDKTEEGENLFTLSMHLSPSGGWYWRIKGELALDFDEMAGLKDQLDAIAKTMNWG